MQFIIDLLYDLLSFIIGKPWQLMKDLVDFIKTFVTQTIPGVVYSILPDGVAEYLQTIDLTFIASIVEPVTWFIPFWAILTIYLHAYAIAAGVRFVRFIIGFIPTIEG
jgi:hypothetical protein